MVASSFELVNVVYERFPANEANLQSFAFLPIGSCECRESFSEVDMIRILIYYFAEPSDPISKQLIVCMCVICLCLVLDSGWLILCM